MKRYRHASVLSSIACPTRVHRTHIRVPWCMQDSVSPLASSMLVDDLYLDVHILLGCAHVHTALGGAVDRRGE
jgi:hypothetical protein